MSYTVGIVFHDNWPERARALIEDPPKLTFAHLKELCKSLCETLKLALHLERCFGEQNDKTMYLAPFIRSVIHATATGVDIQHVSLYPLAVDPCLTREPLFRTFLNTVQPRCCYGLVTGIICGTVPFPTNCLDCGEREDAVSIQGITPEEEFDSEESSVDFLDWINGYTKKKGALSTAFYHDQTPPASEKSALLDYSFLARLTVDLVEDTTPLSLFCIGQDDELQSAMTSCLFQRSTWGIRDPLVGIALDRTTAVQILIGWLEDTAESDCFVVHIAQDTSGCYDLSNASEAFKFASIIANVGQRFSTTCQTAIAFTEQLKHNASEHLLKVWRLDQTDLAPCIVPEEPSFTAKMDSWLAGVPLSGYGKDGRSLPSSLTSVSVKSSVAIEASTSSPSRLALAHSNDDDNRHIRFWLFSRLAMTRTLFPYALLKSREIDMKRKPGNLTPEDLYDNVCSQYFNLVSFSWFDTNAEPLDAPRSEKPNRLWYFTDRLVRLKRSLMLPRVFVAERFHALDSDNRVFLIEAIVEELNTPLKNDRNKIITLKNGYPEIHQSTVNADANSTTLDANTLRARFQQDHTALAEIVRTAKDVFDPVLLETGLQPERMLDYHKEEPEWVICDSVGFIRIPGVFTSKTASAAFNLIHPRASTELRKRSISSSDGLANRSAGDDDEDHTATSRFRAEQLRRIIHLEDPDDLFAHSQNLVATCAVREDSDKCVPEEPSLTEPIVETGGYSLKCSIREAGITNDEVVDLRQDLLLPIILSVHKKIPTTFYAGNVNKGRMCATAAVKFYAAMGIYGLGVYTVISEGSVVLVTVSYGEQASEPLQGYTSPPTLFPTDSSLMTVSPQLLPDKVHIVERNAFSFDIAHPLGLLNFVTFLIKLRIEYVPMVVKMAHAACLKAKVQEEPTKGGTLELQNEIKLYLRSMGVFLDGSSKATWM